MKLSSCQSAEVTILRGFFTKKKKKRNVMAEPVAYTPDIEVPNLFWDKVQKKKPKNV